MSKIVCGKHKKLRHTRTIHRTRDVCAISRHPCPRFFSFPFASPSRFIALARARRTERTCRREKGHPRPEKCSALGGWPLDTTNRYRPFDMDLGIGTGERKSSRSTVVVQYQSRPSRSCSSSFVPFATNKVTLFRYLYRSRNELSYLFILSVAKEYFKIYKNIVYV